MSLNAKKAPKPANKSSRVEQPLMEVGTEEARVVQIVDLGLQKQRPFKGQEKPPIRMIRITYEFPNLFIVDEEGNDVEDKPRWLSEEIPFNNLDVDLAKSTKRYKAIDPEDTNDGDFIGLLGMPCMVTVGEYDYMANGERKNGNEITNVSTITKRKADKLPELVNEAKSFLLDTPDMELFNNFPEWLQKKIKGNLEFEGSVLADLLNGGQQQESSEASDPKKKQPTEPKKKLSEADEEEEQDEPSTETADEEEEEDFDW